MTRCGVLALQGSFSEHAALLRKCGARVKEVRTKEDLREVDRLILPGGESTAIRLLLQKSGLMGAIREKALAGMPVWGTCAGCILLAKAVSDGAPTLSLMDIEVKRNAYGAQSGSFSTSEHIPVVSNEALELVFIRAPVITGVHRTAQILSEVNDRIAAVREGNFLATAFHPELTENTAFHRYFLSF